MWPSGGPPLGLGWHATAGLEKHASGGLPVAGHSWATCGSIWMNILKRYECTCAAMAQLWHIQAIASGLGQQWQSPLLGQRL